MITNEGDSNDIYEKKTPLSKLLDILDDAIKALETHIAQLESKEEVAYCRYCGDAPHVVAVVKTCCNCGEKH